MSNFVKIMNDSVYLGGYSDITISGSLAVSGSLTQAGIKVLSNENPNGPYGKVYGG